MKLIKIFIKLSNTQATYAHESNLRSNVSKDFRRDHQISPYGWSQILRKRRGEALPISSQHMLVTQRLKRFTSNRREMTRNRMILQGFVDGKRRRGRLRKSSLLRVAEYRRRWATITIIIIIIIIIVYRSFSMLSTGWTFSPKQAPPLLQLVFSNVHSFFSPRVQHHSG